MDPAVSPSEAMDLLLVVAAVPILASLMGRLSRTMRIRFWAGYLFLLGGSIVTIAEGYALPEVLNAAEHALYALSGICFALGAAPWLDGWRTRGE